MYEELMNKQGGGNHEQYMRSYKADHKNLNKSVDMGNS